MCRVHKKANLKESVWCVLEGSYRDVWAYIENPFLFFFRRGVPPTAGTGFHYTTTRVVRIKVRDMCLTLAPNCSPQSGDDN